MKTKSFLLLATIAALLTNVGTAQSNDTSDVLVLPKFVVTAPRHTDAEKQVNANLADLRAQADINAMLSRDLPYIKAPTLAESAAHQVAKDLLKLRVAKN
jgi:outer membrane cobalamin receptor